MAKRSYTLTEQKALDAQAQVLDLTWKDETPIRMGDFGQRLRISGVYFQGEGEHVLLLAPTAQNYAPGNTPATVPVRHPDLGLWCRIIRQTDDPVIFEQDPTGMIKTIHRKLEYQISAGTQWTIWERDGFQCLYCGKKGGYGVPLTIDHVMPLEKGGTSDIQNLASACRACAKDKGSKLPDEFCQEKGYDYFGLTEYLSGKAPISFIAHLQDKNR